jgi:hypothetical protein
MLPAIRMIKKTTILSILITSIHLCNLFGQNYTFDDLINSVQCRHNIDFDTIKLCDLYVFDGIPFDSITLRKELRKYKYEDIRLTLLADVSDNTFQDKNCDYMIIIGTGKTQTNEEKRKILKRVQDNLNTHIPDTKIKIRDITCNECIRVVINGKPIGLYEAKELINNIKIKEIEFIVIYDSANAHCFGSYAKNGLVELYMKNKSR